MKTSRPKVVILGSSGFVGSVLFHELMDVRCYQVHGYDSSNLDLLSPSCEGELSEVLDENTVLIVAARSRAKDALEGLSNDVQIAKNVARVLYRRKIRKCVYFSTLCVYSDAETNLAITENTEISPSSFYGIGKYTGESLLRMTALNTGIPVLVFRPCKFYGPGDPSGAYGPTAFIDGILREGKVGIYGDGSELRDHIHIGDLVRITCEMALGGHTGVYNLASGESRSFKDILGMLKEISGKDFQVVSMERSRPKVDQGIDMTRFFEQMPGFRFTPLEQGLRESYTYFLKENERRLKHG